MPVTGILSGRPEENGYKDLIFMLDIISLFDFGLAFEWTIQVHKHYSIQTRSMWL